MSQFVSHVEAQGYKGIRLWWARLFCHRDHRASIGWGYTPAGGVLVETMKTCCQTIEIRKCKHCGARTDS